MPFRILLIVLVTLSGTTGFATNRPSSSKPKRIKVRPTFTDGIRSEGSIIFSYVDEKRRRRLTLDLYRPEKADKPSPVIVMFFGGGWQNGRPGLFAPLGQRLAQLGYVTVVPEYRLSGEAPFPAAVHDCKAAVRWIRKYAKRYNADPGRIATIGGSAGGHLSGFVAATNGRKQFEGKGDHQDVSSEVQAGIVMCGPMDLLDSYMMDRIKKSANTPTGDAVVDFMGGALPWKNRKHYQLASPLTHVDRNTPPMLFIDGEFDRPKQRYPKMWTKLDELNIAHEFVQMPKAPHPYWAYEEWFEPTAQAVDAFLEKHLR